MNHKLDRQKISPEKLTIREERKSLTKRLFLLTAAFALFFVLCATPVAAADTDHQDHSGWTKITTGTALSTITSSGKYYLGNDITTTGTWTLPENVDITLCLNGHVLKHKRTNYGAYKDGIKIQSGAKLILEDCTDVPHYFSKSGNLWVLDDADTSSPYKVTGGVIIPDFTNPVTDNGGGINIMPGGTLIMKGGNIVGNNARSDAGGVYNEGVFTMEGGSIKGNIAGSNGGGVCVIGSTAEFTMTGGEISYNAAGEYGNGGGVSVSGGHFEMSGNAEITGNIAGSNGGGVYSNGGSFTMSENAKIANNQGNSGGGVNIENGCTFTQNGGNIKDNKADDCGGAVYIGFAGIFNQNGGNIKDNTAKYSGGAVYAGYLGNFTMNGGDIICNKAITNGKGAGVYVGSFGSTFNMKGGNIKNNTFTESSGIGAGVYCEGTFNMEAGNIKDNIATDNGGGVSVSGSTAKFTMTGGEISGNEVGEYNNGGGVCVSNGGTFELSGEAKIAGNKANNGGGVCMNGGTFNMTDNVKIANNKADAGGGVYIANGCTFNMDGGTIVANTAAEGSGVYNYLSTFNLNNGNIKDNIANTGNGGGMYIGFAGTVNMKGGEVANNTAKFGGGVYDFSGTFNLDGGNIKDNVAGEGGGVYDKGRFVMTAGNIIGNEANTGNGGGVYNGYDFAGTFTMSGGKIADNRAINSGGGVYDDGTFTLIDGKIENNTAKIGGGVGSVDHDAVGKGGPFVMKGGSINNNKAVSGSGVHYYGDEFKMTGGEITANKANSEGDSKYPGSCVYVHGGGLNMTGGSITDNIATDEHDDDLFFGGVFVEGTITLSGKVNITENKVNDIKDNLFLQDGKKIKIGDAGLASGSKIGVTVLTSPTADKPVDVTEGTVDESYKDYFIADKNTLEEIEYDADAQKIVLVALAQHDDHDSFVGGKGVNSLEAITGEGSYYLTGDITGDGDEWSVPKDCEINLCLNGHVIIGYNIKIDSGATLNLYDCGEDVYYFNEDSGLWILDLDATSSQYNVTGGVITAGGVNNAGTFNMYGGNLVGNPGTDGGAVYNTGSFNMYGGNIVGNSVSTYGGGVYSNNIFVLRGGNITKNIAERGGGVYDIGSFTMEGGNIEGNIASGNGGGVYNAKGSGSSFTLTDGNIVGNEANDNGGGVYDDGIFTMNGGNISGNKAKHGGGVSSVEHDKIGLGGKFTMNGGNIANNEAESGAGVHYFGPTFEMSGGEITGNKATGSNEEDYVGGGVCVHGDGSGTGGDFVMHGGSITNNAATNNDADKCFGGVYAEGSITLDGKVRITGNTCNGYAENLFLLDDETISIGEGGLQSGSSIGVTTQTAPTEGDSIEITGDTGEANAQYFFADKTTEEIKFNYRTKRIVLSFRDSHAEHDDLTGWVGILSLEMITEKGTEGNYYLMEDIFREDTWSVPANCEINLCLNGHVIKKTGEGSVIKVPAGATLNIYDCGKTLQNFKKEGELWVWDETRADSAYNVTGGVITGGNAVNGGAVDNLGTFTINGGNIVGNAATAGGAVCNYGTFIMSGGNIVGNTADYGAGVNNNAVVGGISFTMTGGNIVENTASINGGGVYSANAAEFTMSGGNITENKAEKGDGVYNKAYSFKISDKANVNGVYLEGYAITVTGNEFTGGATGIDGLKNGDRAVQITDSTLIADDIINKFTLANDDQSLIASDDNKALEVYEAYPGYTGVNSLDDITGPGKYYLKDNVTSAGTWDVPQATGEGEGVTLNLNGHWITNDAKGYVINVPGDAILNIEDETAVTHYFDKEDSGLWKLNDTATDSAYNITGGAITGGNSAYGGGVHIDESGNFAMTGGNIVGNKAEFFGGGVYNDKGNFTLTGGKIAGNIVNNGKGGGVDNNGGNFAMAGGVITDNFAEEGGAVFNSGEGKFTMEKGSITENKAENGGAVYNGLKATFEMKDGSIEGNIAGKGGAVYNNGGNFTLANANIPSNIADKGSAVYNDAAGNFVMTGSATTDGVYLDGSCITLEGNTFEGDATNITGIKGGDVAVQIAVGSPILAEDMLNSFTLKDGTKILIVNRDDNSLVVNGASTPKISSAALSLSTDIAVRFYVLDEALDGYSDPYINVTFEGKEFGPIRPTDDTGKHRKVFTFKDISPADMLDEITVTLYATEEGEIKPTLCNERTYSVNQYCMNMINKYNTQNALTTLCVDMLNYGSASQEYRKSIGKEETGELANSTLSETQKEWASTIIDPSIRENDFNISDNGDDAVGVWKAAGLSLYSDVTVIFKFESDDVSNLKAEIKYGDGLSKTKEVTEFKDSTYVKEGESFECKSIEFNALNARELNDAITVTLINTETNEVSNTLTYSVDAYSFAKKDDGSVNALTNSLMKYIRAVDKFVTA